MAHPLYIGPLPVEPPLLQAPMAGYSNYAYRQMVRRLGGVGLPATEMVSARSFLHISGSDRRNRTPTENYRGLTAPGELQESEHSPGAVSPRLLRRHA